MCRSSNYWSGSTNVNNADNAWNVNFNNGNVNNNEPIFERRFIHDSYACREDRGVQAAVNRLRSFRRRAGNSRPKVSLTVVQGFSPIGFKLRNRTRQGFRKPFLNWLQVRVYRWHKNQGSNL